MAHEYVILVAGPMGAGKTTAIAALSEIPVISTDAVNTDLARNAKATTTVALDYGEITLGDDCMVSVQVHLQQTDSHPIFDARNGERINRGKHIRIGNHVWIDTNGTECQ